MNVMAIVFAMIAFRKGSTLAVRVTDRWYHDIELSTFRNIFVLIARPNVPLVETVMSIIQLRITEIIVIVIAFIAYLK
jgi:hypothetical protein